MFWHHSQKTQVMGILFLEWFYQCFVPKGKKCLEEKGLTFKVLLIIYNVPGHSQSLCFTKQNMEMMFLDLSTM